MKKRKTLTVAILLLQLALITSSINAINLKLDYEQVEETNSKIIEIFQQFSIPKIKDNNDRVLQEAR